MARQTKRKQVEPTTFPILKTVEQMSKISGIGLPIPYIPPKLFAIFLGTPLNIL